MEQKGNSHSRPPAPQAQPLRWMISYIVKLGCIKQQANLQTNEARTFTKSAECGGTKSEEK